MGKNKGPDIPQQSLKVDIDKILKRFRKDIVPEFNRWQENRPELQQLNDFTQGTMIPGLTNLLKHIPNVSQAINPLQHILDTMPSAGQTIAPLQRILGALPNAGQFAAPIGRVSDSLENTMRHLMPLQQLINPIQGVTQQLQQRMGNLMNVAPVLARGLATQAPIISSGGAPTQAQQHSAQQAALQTMSQGGNVYGNQAAAADILKRWQVQQQNMQNAIGNVQGLEGIQSSDVANRLGLGQGITSAQQAIGGLQQQDVQNRLGLGQGITAAQQARQGVYGTDATIREGLVNAMDALRSSDVNRRLGLTSGIQGIRGTDIAQRLGLMQGITGAIEQPLQFGLNTFNSLMNPLMGFAGNVFDANQNAAAAQNIAGANKSSGLTSGILSSLGAVGGGVAIAV